MTKKHFIALADAIRGTDVPDDGTMFNRGRRLQYSVTVGALVDFCRAQNPRFNTCLWLGYLRGECGPNGGKLK